MGRRGPPLAVRLPAVPRNGAHRCVVPPQLRRLGRARHPRDRRHGTVCRRRDDQAWYRGGPRCVLATGPRALGGDGAVAELLRRAHAIGAGVHRRLEGHVGRRAVRALRRRARRARRRPQPPVPTTARPARPEGRHRPRERGDLVRVPRPGRLACADSARTRLGARARTSGDDDRLADDEPARIALLAEARLPPDLPAPASLRRMTRVPLLAGSRIAIVTTGDDDVVLAPPPPREPIADVAAAVRDALRFPLAGEPLEALVPRGGRATIVVEPPNLPVPSTPLDPRPAALEATVDALERAGIVSERLTILVAGGLARRAGRAELELLVPPPLTRRFRGAVEVHDAASPELVAVPAESRREIRVHRALVDTDLVVTISAAETVLHGGPGLLVSAADAETIRAAGAYSLLETTASQGWQIAVAIERALARRAPVIGASLVLTLPRLTGMLQGYPYDSESLDRVVRSPLRHLFSLLPGAIRERALRTVPASRGASAAARQSSCIRSTGASHTRPSSRIASSSARCAAERRATSGCCVKRKPPRRTTRSCSTRTVQAVRIIRCSRMRSGRPAVPHSDVSAPSSSRGAATTTRRARSASCRRTGPARRCRWHGRAPRKRRGSASCWRRPISRCGCAHDVPLRRAGARARRAARRDRADRRALGDRRTAEAVGPRPRARRRGCEGAARSSRVPGTVPRTRPELPRLHERRTRPVLRDPRARRRRGARTCPARPRLGVLAPRRAPVRGERARRAGRALLRPARRPLGAGARRRARGRTPAARALPRPDQPRADRAGRGDPRSPRARPRRPRRRQP